MQVWLLRSSRGKVTGPFSGHQLHDMLHADEVPEDSLCKQEGWKAWKGIEEVEVRLACLGLKPVYGACLSATELARQR